MVAFHDPTKCAHRTLYSGVQLWTKRLGLFGTTHGKHVSRNYIMKLFGAICHVLSVDNFKLQQFVIHLIDKAEQVFVSEIAFTHFGQE